MTLDKFDDIHHLPLRVFNRVAYLHNLMESAGRTPAQEYIDLFSEEERKQMFVLGSYIRKVGVEKVRKEVTKNLELVDDE